MRIRIRHETAYAYGTPARSAIQLMRMTPRSFDGHFVRHWRAEIDADARLGRDEDAYGNITHMVFVEGPVGSVNVRVEGEVDTADTKGIVRGTVERLPLPFYLRETALTKISPRLRDLADAAAASAKSDALAGLHRLMMDINSRMAFAVGATTTATTADSALESGQGVCQDYAHIFIAGARVLRRPARYVSGYYLRTDRQEQDAGHAWAEAHVSGLGWVGFDPTNGVCMTDRHVRVAVGADYLEAAPARGARVGGADELLSVKISIAQGRGLAEG